MWDKVKSVKGYFKTDRQNRDKQDLNFSYSDPRRDRISLDRSFHSELNFPLHDDDIDKYDPFQNINNITSKTNIISVLNNPKKVQFTLFVSFIKYYFN